MLFSIAFLLLSLSSLPTELAPREREEDAHIHGAGQIGLLAAVALFGVDYFTSYFYATGEMMSALHPYGLQQYGYIAVAVIALANFVFGALYMYSLGIFNEGGGSYTASMRYLTPDPQPDRGGRPDPGLRVDHRRLGALRRRPAALDPERLWHRTGSGISSSARRWPSITWYLTIRGRGESAAVVFTLLGIFVMLTVTMAVGLFIAHVKGVPAAPHREHRQARHAWPGALSPADRLDERHGRADRPGSHVQRHPVRHQRGCRPGQVGQEAPPAPASGCGISTAASPASGASCRPPSCSTAA